MYKSIILILCIAAGYLNAFDLNMVDNDLKALSGTSEDSDFYRKYYENGKIKYEVPLINGQRYGIQRGYYESGKIKYEVPFVNGKARGYLKVYYENGNLKMSAVYLDNKKDGLWKGYKENGEPAFSYIFKDNEPVKILFEE